MVCFISGIDTDSGKTIATGMMARYLLKRGRRVITMKLVQTGNVGYSEDLLRHRELMSVGNFPEDESGLTAPCIFRFPASPHLAAALERREVEIPRLEHAVKELAQRYEYVLVEGAGGLMVPLTGELLTVDFAARLRLPLILVASGKLGGLNHALLSIECAGRRCLELAGVVYNWCATADPVIAADSERMIEQYLRKSGIEPRMVRLPKVEMPLPDVDFSAIFPEA